MWRVDRAMWRFLALLMPLGCAEPPPSSNGIDLDVAPTEGHPLPAASDYQPDGESPYAGGWPVDACRHAIEGTGNAVGEIATDFELVDQHGELVRLHDFCGQEVLLVTSAQWCPSCQGEAPGLQALYDRYRAYGFLVITLLGEDLRGEPPAPEDLRDWADAFGLTHPVVSDGEWAVTRRFVAGALRTPTAHLLAPGAEVRMRDGWVSDEQVEAWLP